LFVVGTNPDVAVIDISLKGGDGIDLLKRIKAHNGTARLLVWSTYSEGLCAERALRAGTLGYVNKDQATDQIVVAILHVLDGKVYLSDTMAERMLHRAVGGGKPPSAAHRLIRSPTGSWRSFDWSARV
jgi:DNA-binding NarL/FixJ family response regulator